MSVAMKIKRVKVNSASELPENAAETPGGTMFAFTPGGTKIIYDRDFLLHLKHSPASKGKPNLPNIPGVTTPTSPLATESCSGTIKEEKEPEVEEEQEEEQHDDDMEL
ncbi:Oidioi.mRNA.OKI2018_I69.chr2.g4624.t1.cds [Oikopleura dioica]|uniref:Oidioi.mRNA.OKI2018_I69.chr2.g4624.t1.cds n=1 Tax=Oikopleura dioica TaxID=34765 RepID=A0ABN7T268_OIKDI|nr:Oidioi.mRNA.OKI2018_I69.chr2.g4624.t1.cds [Oikopleura dioica]